MLEKKNNLEELNDDELENAAGGAAGKGGSSTRRPGSGVSSDVIANEQANGNEEE